ncbi:hypothetical protein Tco_0903750 [Tanacetum coccineum]
MDIFTKGALWDYWKLGSDEIEPTNEESADLEETNHDNEQEISEFFSIETNLFNYETPLCEKFKEFNYLLKIDLDLLTKEIEGFKTYEEYKAPVVHYCRPFNYKSGYSEWPTCSWKEDGYCNGGNLPGAYIVGNMLYYPDLEWYDTPIDRLNTAYPLPLDTAYPTFCPIQRIHSTDQFGVVHDKEFSMIGHMNLESIISTSKIRENESK